jgi:hypothetical protein
MDGRNSEPIPNLGFPPPILPSSFHHFALQPVIPFVPEYIRQRFSPHPFAMMVPVVPAQAVIEAMAGNYCPLECGFPNHPSLLLVYMSSRFLLLENTSFHFLEVAVMPLLAHFDLPPPPVVSSSNFNPPKAFQIYLNRFASSKCPGRPLACWTPRPSDD